MSSLPLEVFELIEPEEYHHRYFSHQIRSDGRAFDELRPISVVEGIISSVAGSAMIHWGHSIVLASIRTEVAEPLEEKPNEGYLGK